MHGAGIRAGRYISRHLGSAFERARKSRLPRIARRHSKPYGYHWLRSQYRYKGWYKPHYKEYTGYYRTNPEPDKFIFGRLPKAIYNRYIFGLPLRDYSILTYLARSRAPVRQPKVLPFWYINYDRVLKAITALGTLLAIRRYEASKIIDIINKLSCRDSSSYIMRKYNIYIDTCSIYKYAKIRKRKKNIS